MKIKEVRTIPLLGTTPISGWEHETRPEDNLHTLVEIETQDGLVGVGSCYTSAALVNASLEVLAPALIGESAIEPERVSEKLHQMTFWQGRGGAITHAISGIDIALWDLLGKASGQPVARLLGGYYRQRIIPYASVIFGWPPEAFSEMLQGLVERGFRAIKMGWGSFGLISRERDEMLVSTARNAVGDDIHLMVDAGASGQFWPNDYKWAMETAAMLYEYGIAWFEEPLRPDDIEGFVTLREHSPVPIASCEVFTRRQSFLPWIERRAVDIVQPDCTKVGGLSEARRIAWMAYDHGVTMVSHGWNTVVGLYADLALAAAMPDAKYVEYITPSPYLDDLTVESPSLDADGCLAIPTAPGLGIELDPDKVAKYSRQRVTTFS
ncbi:MAG TPA: mandelate racemase/muconate lactonizing enzyme family protein [Chloroflexi bacterium]|jgi:D-galactarolactone cycloisomerase|nr:mandelate racemase/muconate lactonizing enzyme family protein [Chloroflexota bacterium]